MDLLSTIIECIRGPSTTETEEAEFDHKPLLPSSISPRSAQDIAEDVIHIIQTAEKRGRDLQIRIHNTVDTQGWTEEIAKAILDKLQQVINQGQQSAVLQEAIDSVTQVVRDIFQFARDHPDAAAVFCTLVALGVLVLIGPWIIEALGFGELGPVEGKIINQSIFMQSKGKYSQAKL